MTPWLYFIGGVGTFIAAITGAVVMLIKFGPEVNKIQIESSKNLVAMAESAAKLQADAAEDLRKRNKILDDRVTEQAKQLGEQKQAIKQALRRITELEHSVQEVHQLRSKVDQLSRELDKERHEKHQIARENRQLTDRVKTLETELHDFKKNGHGE